MKVYLLRQTALTIMMMLSVNMVFAEENEAEKNFVNIFSMSWMQDSNDSDSGSVGIGLQMYDVAEFNLYGGASTISDSQGDIDTELYGAGLGSINGEQADIAIHYDYWGKQEELTVETWSLPVNFYLLDWTVGITPEFRDITLWTNKFAGVRNKIGRKGKGIVARITHHRWYPFEWWIEYGDYSYNQNLAVLNTRLAGLIFSNTSLQLSSNFVDHHTTFATRYYINPVQLELRYSQSLSAVDGSHTDSYELNSSIKFSDMFSLMLAVGQTQPETGDAGEYGQISIEMRN